MSRDGYRLTYLPEPTYNPQFGFEDLYVSHDGYWLRYLRELRYKGVPLRIHDWGGPGTADSIGFTLWNNNALWFSSNWTGTQTLEQVLAGGNLVVHTEPLALHAANGPVGRVPLSRGG